MKEIKLYYSEMCPFCTGLVEYIEEEKLDVELMNATRDIKLQKDIYLIGGKSQVPMMTIDGEPMYESNDIMEWLKENM